MSVQRDSSPSEARVTLYDKTTVKISDADAQEHGITLTQALRLYPKAIFWSVVLSAVVIQEGYDTKLIGSLYAQPAFQKAFGQPAKKGYEISAPWQAGLGNGSSVGQLLGLLVAGSLTERFGFRRTMIWGLIATAACIFLPFFATTLPVLTVGQILFGVPLGFFQVTTVIYALEVSPTCLRPFLTNYVAFCWSAGHLLAACILRGTLNMDGRWAYRIPFAIQWFWPTLLIPLIYIAPESPWWLVRQHRYKEAKEVVKRLTSPAVASRTDVNFDIDKNIAYMVATTELERRIRDESSYQACFKGTNLRRTVITAVIYMIQTFNGNPLRSFSTYFLKQAGLPTDQAFNMTIGGFALAIAAVFFSFVLLPLFGRRSIYNTALALMFLVNVIIGSLGVARANTGKAGYSWAIGSILLASQFLYSCSIGPLTNTFCAELPSAILRSRSIALARWAYIITTIVAGVLTPYMLNPTAWNWSAKTGFLYAGTCMLSLVFSYFFVPEPKDRTTAEIDIMFEKGVPARHFKTTQVIVPEEFVKR